MRIADALGMMVYSSCEGAPDALKFIDENGLGILQIPGHIYNQPRPWALDNGAYSAWVHDRPFDDGAFEGAIEKVKRRHWRNPDFGVIPDKVAAGLESLYYSERWMSRLDAEWPWYLAVQDGMTLENVYDYREDIQGIFVGGTLNWKLKTGEDWVKFAHQYGLKCHIGRCGVKNRILWAKHIGADSIDSGSWARNQSYYILVQAAEQAQLVTTLSQGR